MADMVPKSQGFLIGNGFVVLVALWTSTAWSQRIRFPTQDVTVAQSPAAAPAWTAPTTAPPVTGTPLPGATLNQGIQPFDPYATGSAPPIGPPSLPAPSLPPPYYPYAVVAPPVASPYGNVAPPIISPYATGTPPVGAAYGAGTPPGFPPTQQPSSLYPQGMQTTIPWATPNGGPHQRLFQNTGFTYAYLYGTESNQLQMHDVDVSTSLVLQFFARNEFGFRITPGFTFHFLDGPQPPLPTDTNLPAQLYDAYLDFQWDPKITQQFHIELDFRMGVYSEPETVTTDSVRYTGTGIAVLQLTPATALKLGVTYLDRLEIKILPAIGFLYEPNPQTKFDVFFPEPKIAKYWTTMGSAAVWWYLRGYYGAGNWTVKEYTDDVGNEFTDRVDINDIRVIGGLEWHGSSQRVGFMEAGYVFSREIVYYAQPQNNLDLESTFMLGAGIRF